MKPTIICLTPIRNEAWILDTFIQTTSLWADYIIIADQMSTDESVSIAKKYKKVILVENNNPEYDEASRQKLLIDESRKIEGQKLLITLDADEIFTPNFIYSKEWNLILNSTPGTVIHFKWANIFKNFGGYWTSGFFAWGYMDDGFEHNTDNKIHNSRIPLPDYAQNIYIEDIKVMHLQYVNWERMQSKHRWYQCYERTTYPEKSPIEIFRQYHHMYEIDKQKLSSVPIEWIDLYKSEGIDITNFRESKYYWWDEKVLGYFDEFGAQHFKKIYIWDVDWRKIAGFYNRKVIKKYKDPRNIIDKLIHRFLFITQKHKNEYWIRKITNQIRKRYF